MLDKNYYWVNIYDEWRIGQYDETYAKNPGFWLDGTEYFCTIGYNVEDVNPEDIGPLIGRGPEES